VKLLCNQNTTASYQIAIGADSLYLNNGGYNTAIGYEALRFNTSGVQNTSIGYQSMRLSTIGDVNTAIGYGSGGSLNHQVLIMFL
jgi:trimeric autotransporter adhesin